MRLIVVLTVVISLLTVSLLLGSRRNVPLFMRIKFLVVWPVVRIGMVKDGVLIIGVGWWLCSLCSWLWTLVWCRCLLWSTWTLLKHRQFRTLTIGSVLTTRI